MLPRLDEKIEANWYVNDIDDFHPSEPQTWKEFVEIDG